MIIFDDINDGLVAAHPHVDELTYVQLTVGAERTLLSLDLFRRPRPSPSPKPRPRPITMIAKSITTQITAQIINFVRFAFSGGDAITGG